MKENGLNRSVFRSAMKGVLPEKVRLKSRKLTPYPAETLRQALQKPHMREELNRMRGNPHVTAFVDVDGLSAYISKIREPEDIVEWMNNAAKNGEQVVQHELYHVFAIWLAWYLDQHGTDVA